MGHPTPVQPRSHHPSRRPGTDRHHQNFRVVDPHRACLSTPVPAKAAPAPLFRCGYQSTRDRIAMDIAQLLNSLSFRPHVEVVVPRLPEPMRNGRRVRRRNCCGRKWGAPGLAAFARPGNGGPRPFQTANEAKLQCLYRSGQRRPLRFSHQQMNMLGHDDVSQDHQPIAAAHAFECPQEQISAICVAEQWLALVAAKRHEMQVPYAIDPVEILRHRPRIGN